MRRVTGVFTTMGKLGVGRGKTREMALNGLESWNGRIFQKQFVVHKTEGCGRHDEQRHMA